jgi:peptidoglycan/LPS O-acetylase OafA/YrhL
VQSKEQSAHYRPDIDGLRAVAVLLVVAYHAFPNVVPGGFVGVDVFFVISGYLITGILLREQRANEFTFLGFYARRFRRIIPALLVVLAATWIAGRYVLLMDEFESLGRHTFGGATFTSNFILWSEAGYFDSAAELKPLLHLWSLAIEEQFYLLWPMLLAFAWRRRWNLLAVVAALLCISFGTNVATIAQHPSFAFYLLPARFWELLIGCGVACLPAPRAPRFANLQAGAAGVALVAVSFVIDRATPYPGWWALVPTAATALFISAGPTAFLNRRILSNRGAVLIGLISYPLYLWHWPILSMLRITHEGTPSVLTRAGAVALSVVLAWLTWRLVERYAQTRLFSAWSPRARARGYVVAALGGLLLVGAAGGLTARGALYTASQKRAVALASYSHYEPKLEGFSQCFLTNSEGPENVNPYCTKSWVDTKLLVWGDSYARHLFPPINDRYGHMGAAMLLSASACLPVVGLVHPIRPRCVEINDFVSSQIEKLKPKVVVLQGVWFYYFYKDDFFPKLDATIARLYAAGVEHVIVVGQFPVWQPTLPRVLQRHYLLKGLPVPERSRAGIDHGYWDADAALEKHFAGSKVEFVSPMNGLCNGDGCVVRVGENLATDLMAFDAGHLTNAGSEYVYTHVLEPALSRALPPEPMRVYDHYGASFQARYGGCFLEPQQGPAAFDRSCYTPAGGGDELLLWGDSYALHLYPGLSDGLKSVHILRLNASSCLPVIGWSPENRPHCKEVNDFVLERVRAVKPKIVVLDGIWYYGYQSPGFFDKLDETIKLIKAAGVKNIVVFGQLPMWQPALPRIVQRDYLMSGQPVPARSRTGIEPGFFDVDPIFEKHFAGSDVRYVPAMEQLCNQDGCPIKVGDNPQTDLIAFDEGHLTTAGSDYVVNSLLSPVLNAAIAVP